MKWWKLVLASTMMLALVAASSLSGCTNPDNSETNKEKVTDGGDAGTDKKVEPPIELTFEPATGAELETDGCVKVKFSRAPSQRGWTVKLKAEGSDANQATTFAFNPDGDQVELCPLSFLKQGTKYSLEVEVKEKVEQGSDARRFKANATYNVKKTYTADEPPKTGSPTINFKINVITAPAGLNDVVSGLGDDDLPPILVSVHSRDDGKAGNILLVGGLGTNPPGGKPHKGKDVFDTKTPVSLALKGKFDGRWFSVGPTTFVLSISGINLTLQDFTMTGIFSKDGTTLEKGTLFGIVNTALIKERFGLDLCLLLVDQCFKQGNDGINYIRIAATLKGIANPVEYGVFITDPFYLSTGFDPAKALELYFLTKTKKDDVTVKIEVCKDSKDPEKPCSAKEGAKLEVVKDAGSFESFDEDARKAMFKLPSSVTAKTWYKISITSKDANGKTATTFTVLQTK
jgi:hypothetical protein